MNEPEWRIRSGRPADRDLLASFTCANPSVGWQVEVEQFIRTQLIDWTSDPHAVSGDPRLLLAFVTADGELFGVAAHEREILQGGDGAQFHATKLEVLAIATPWQGQRFLIGERASDVLMSAVMTDISRGQSTIAWVGEQRRFAHSRVTRWHSGGFRPKRGEHDRTTLTNGQRRAGTDHYPLRGPRNDSTSAGHRSTLGAEDPCPPPGPSPIGG